MNSTGLRFASELGRRDAVTHSILGEEVRPPLRSLCFVLFCVLRTHYVVVFLWAATQGLFTIPQSVRKEMEEKGQELPDPRVCSTPACCPLANNNQEPNGGRES